MNLVVASLTAVSAFIVTAVGTAALIPHLRRAGAIDEPNHRSSHDRPTPRGGGIVLALTATGAALILGAWLRLEPSGLVLLLSAVAMAFLGLLDDLRELGVRTRLAWQSAAAVAVLVAFSGRTDALVGAALVLAGTAFIVGATNIFNFMDGIDGIAAGTGAVSGINAIAVGAWTGHELLTAVGVSLAAASAGFLTQNWSPARVFMGDAGSLFLGFSLSCLVAASAVLDLAAASALVAPLLPFLVDGSATILDRYRHGESVTSAHRSHVYQRAAQRYGHAKVSASYIGVAAISGLAINVCALAGSASGVVSGVSILALLGMYHRRLSFSLTSGDRT